VACGVMPLLEALACPADILGTQHRNSPIEITTLGHHIPSESREKSKQEACHHMPQTSTIGCRYQS
jgi:hypothetical protein